MQRLKDIGELAAIERLAKYFPARPDVVDGIGDDCAVVRVGGNAQHDFVLTSDPVIEGTHFTHDTPPRAIGHKAMGRVISDIAAMGGEPLWGLMDLVAPADMPVDKLDDICQGMADLIGRHGLAVIGGDLSKGPVLEIHAFAVGLVPKDRALLRSGAQAGDDLYVTGSLGGSLHGKHLSFEPRVKEGIFLRDWATSLIDVSDGLASDLRHIVDMSRVGARLETVRIPVSQAVQATKDGKPPLEHAFQDGEDFELLFTVPCGRQNDFQATWSHAFPDLACTRIGSITDQKGVIECVSGDGRIVTLTMLGYRHFG